MLGGSLDRVRNAMESLRTRLWLIPGIMCVAAAGLARLAARLDDIPLFRDLDTWWYFGGEPGTARALLGTLLSGMLTMTSLVISITMVVLSLAANQLGPRLIWNFIRDRQIQVVIGIFFATIVYVLIVLRSVREESVPDVAVTVATALVGICLFALLFYVHKVARSIVADTVIDHVASDLSDHVSSLPDPPDEPDQPATLPQRLTTCSLGLDRSGYVQVVEYDRLRDLSAERDLGIEVAVRPGDLVLRNGDHLRIHGADAPSDHVAKAIRGAFLVGSHRTPTQDLEYSVRQLVEIAVRALSPGINDPFTAITVLHRLGQTLELLMRKHLPETVVRRDENGIVRVIGRASTFDGAMDAALNQIRQAASGQGDVAVLISLASILGQLARACPGPDQRAAVARHLQAADRAARRAIADPADLADFAAVHRAAEAQLDR